MPLIGPLTHCEQNTLCVLCCVVCCVITRRLKFTRRTGSPRKCWGPLGNTHICTSTVRWHRAVNGLTIAIQYKQKNSIEMTSYSNTETGIYAPPPARRPMLPNYEYEYKCSVEIAPPLNASLPFSAAQTVDMRNEPYETELRAYNATVVRVRFCTLRIQ